MSPEELDEARANEALRLFDYVEDGPHLVGHGRVAIANIAARLARENWTPPKPVDPDVLAFREWAAKDWAELYPEEVDDVQWGKRDDCGVARAYLAGARMATARERERAKELVKFVEADARRLDGVGDRARAVLAKHRGEA